MSLSTDLAAGLSARLAAGHRPGAEEIHLLAESTDVISLGMLADEARQRRHARQVTFVRVAELPVHDAVSGLVSIPAAAREVRLVGRPESMDEASEAVRAVVARAAGRPITGFALDDLEALCEGDTARVGAGLQALRVGGLGLVAELVLDRAASPEALCHAAQAAGIGIASLVIDRADPFDVVGWSQRVERLGSEGAQIQSFAPLPRDAGTSAASTGYDDIRRVALARLIVDTIGSIQIDWTLHGPKLAQVSLTVGADDLDRVSSLDAPDLGNRRAPLEEVRRNIRAAGYEPVERDGRFSRLAS